MFTNKVNVQEIRASPIAVTHNGLMDLTIEELANAAEIPVSTIRMYQHRGLLQPPERRGRVGYYNADHQARLRLIAALQSRGFSLAAIKEAVDALATGRSLSSLLGIDAGLGDGAVASTAPVRLTPLEFAQKYEGANVTQADIQRAADLGLLSLDGADIVVRNAAFADIGAEVARMGIPVSVVLDETESLHRAVTGIADRFREVFDAYLWQPFASAGMPQERLGELVTDANRLTQLATRVLVTELNEQFAAFIDDYARRAAEASSIPDEDGPVS